MLMLIGTNVDCDNAFAIISIHLMLMLIPLLELVSSCNLYFNTSHVNVNRVALMVLSVWYWHFNTSHVNVNRTALSSGGMI